MTRVLVVDDRQDDLDLTVLILHSFGCEVTEAASGPAALELLEDNEVDVVVSDILMPGMDGYEFARAIRKDERWTTLPLVFASAAYEEGDMSDLADIYGGCHFVGKPIDPETLRHTIEEALHGPVIALDFDSPAGQVERLRLLTAKLLLSGERVMHTQTELERRGTQQQAIATLGNFALSTRDLAQMLERSASLVKETLDCERVEITVLPEIALTPGRQIVVSSSGIEVESIAAPPPMMTSRLAALAIDGGSVVIEAPVAEPWLDALDSAAAAGTTFAAVVSIGAPGSPLGSLSTFTTGLRRPSATDRNFLVGVANLLADAIGRVGAEAKSVRLAALVDSSGDAIISNAADGTVTSWNPAAERLYGYLAEDAVGRPFSAMVSDKALPAFRQVQQRLARGEFVPACEMVHRRSDGEALEIELTASPIADSGGASAVVIRDVSDRNRGERERRSLAAQLERAQKLEALGRLAGGIAHDFNNLLMIIGGYSSFALQRKPADVPVREAIEHILVAVDRASALTRELLAFGHHEVIEPRVLDLNEVVSEAATMLTRVIGTDIELAIRLEPELGRVCADAGQVQQVIINLAINARDAMPGGGRLVIETSNADIAEEHLETHVMPPPGRYALVTVTDDGAGMDGETIAQIFEPFFTTKPIGVGTGLGLAIVHRIVTQSAGHVCVDSGLARGTTFSVYLPVVASEVESESLPAPAEGASRALIVLLVEDDTDVRGVVTRMLESSGHTVLAACSADDAVRIAGEQEIDIVVTDMVMPGPNGLDVAAAVRALQPNVPVVVMSGFSERLVGEGGQVAKGFRYVKKPFAQHDLDIALSEGIDDARRPDPGHLVSAHTAPGTSAP